MIDSINIYGKVKKMGVVIERIKGNGMIQIPREIMQNLRLSEGDEVALRVDELKIVIAPVTTRRHVRLDSAIVDELVEKEEFFEPEVV